MYPMLSPTVASVSFSSSGGSLWLNSTWGAVWLARRPSLNSYAQNKQVYNNSYVGNIETVRNSWWCEHFFRVGIQQLTLTLYNLTKCGWLLCTRGLTHLHEDFADDDVVVVFEHCAEHHRHSVFLGLHVPDKTEHTREIRIITTKVRA